MLLSGTVCFCFKRLTPLTLPPLVTYFSHSLVVLAPFWPGPTFPIWVGSKLCLNSSEGCLCLFRWGGGIMGGLVLLPVSQ